MYTKSILAVSGLVSVVVATPLAGQHHHQHQRLHQVRDYVWETATEEVVVTVPVTKTVWIEPGQTAPAQEEKEPHQQHHQLPHSYSPPAQHTPDVQPNAYSPPTTPSSVYVAPSPSSVYTPPPPPESSPVEAPPAPVYSSPEAPAYTPETTSTPAYVAPTTSEYVAPTTSAYVAPSAPASPAPYSGGGGSCAKIDTFATPNSNPGVKGLSSGMGASGTSYTGELTYFQQGMGACGEVSSDTDLMVAIGHELFDSYGTGNPNANPLCGKYITINGAGGKKWSAKVLDRCPGCTASDLDLPQAFFNAATDCADGRAHGITWSFD